MKSTSKVSPIQEELHVTMTDIAAWNHAPRADWTAMGDTDHFVQFYEADGFLLNSLSGFIGKAITAGDSAIVVATELHRNGLDELLQANGVDVDGAKARGKYIALDAADTLTKFMVDGVPDRGRFNEVMGRVVAGAADGRSRTRAFGEMVGVLWAEGNHSAAVLLEELWNDLQKVHSFSLFCAYPMNGFGGERFVEPYSNVCNLHARVIPAESSSACNCFATTESKLA
jgi:hypothetical protein